ncbi:hypothetical protein SAMN05444273_10260 [Litoreibacter ascidiaceicola]|uniref:CVNH domain-containing protein n=1 Tax=Litoreibacter ascidiaceicola TaxID=1486859 RepID=A0A1M4UXU3_9RHOB|nr:DUF6636 domain-containing protein [Litoreibacter ascidiaceicola]SHE61453.1 hypothetical protein SAMN05444273_10260 [Litoreibacter ascidiaceicola]
MARYILALIAICAGLPANAEIWIIATRANNIHCEMGDTPGSTQMMCNIFRRSGPLALPKPADCTAQWGHAYFITDRGPVQMLCLEERSNDWPGNGKLDIGKPLKFGGVTCAATRNKLKCKNLDGYGFYLSRGAQEIF